MCWRVCSSPHFSRCRWGSSSPRAASRFAKHSTTRRFAVALVQTVLALWSYIELYRALRTYSPAQLKLRPRFALVFMRWVVVIMVTYFVLDILPPSEPVLLILVVAYIAGSIFAEIAPDRFLRAMPGGADNLEPDASSTTQPSKGRASRTRNRHSKR
jgi:hypothetical protein